MDISPQLEAKLKQLILAIRKVEEDVGLELLVDGQNQVHVQDRSEAHPKVFFYFLLELEAKGYFDKDAAIEPSKSRGFDKVMKEAQFKAQTFEQLTALLIYLWERFGKVDLETVQHLKLRLKMLDERDPFIGGLVLDTKKEVPQ